MGFVLARQRSFSWGFSTNLQLTTLLPTTTKAVMNLGMCWSPSPLLEAVRLVYASLKWSECLHVAVALAGQWLQLGSTWQCCTQAPEAEARLRQVSMCAGLKPCLKPSKPTVMVLGAELTPTKSLDRSNSMVRFSNRGAAPAPAKLPNKGRSGWACFRGSASK